MIWDQIIVEVTKMWEFLNVVEDKRVLVIIVVIKHETTHELMQRRPTERVQNVINFLSNISNHNLITLKVQDRLGIVMRARKFIEMHKLMNQVKMVAEKMREDVKQFQLEFKDVIDKSLPSFLDKDNMLLHKNNYYKFLLEERLNHDKFEDMEKGLKEENIMSKLEHDFDILSQIQKLRKDIPPVSYVDCINLEVMTMEMHFYDLSSKAQWHEINIFL